MKSFDEWFKGAMPNTHKGVGSEKIETFVYETAQDAWNFKQAEVDELRNKIDEALKLLNIAYPESWAYCVDEAINILKGDQS